MMDKNLKIESTRLLAVEGKDECNFFAALLKHIALGDVQMVDIGGKEKFQIEFPLLYNLEDFEGVDRLGFIRDAESQPAQSAFASICDLLRKLRMPIPKARNEIKNDEHPHIGIFIMPDNFGTGMLENLCLKTVESLPQYHCVEEYISCVSHHQSIGEKSIFNESKARVQTYLASCSPIANSLGIGAQKGYWDFNHPCLNDIKRFLQFLFS